MSERLSIHAAAADAGDTPALVTGGRTYTFAELAAQAAAAKPALAAAVPAGHPFALVAHSNAATVVSLLALLELRIPALLVHPKLTPTEQAVVRATTARAGTVVPPDAAAIIHTSGTTGVPRGAVLTHAALCASAAASAANLGWRDDERWLACMPIARVGGLSILTRSLAARRTVVLADAFDVATLPALLARERITLLSVVPTMLARLLDAHPDWAPPPHLRAVLVGGAAASPRLLARAAARGVPIVLTYGMTESCSQVVATPYGDRFHPATRGVGLPLPGAEVRVIEGRIEVRGPMLMAGYHGAPAQEPGAWFDTGDLGRFDDAGCLHVLARRADLIVTGGENVYPAEVERELEACPGVAAAAVFGVRDEVWGETVAAALVADGARPPDDAVVAAWIETRLASHKRPRRFGWLRELPQTAAGKLDREALAALADGMRPLRKG